MTVLTFDQSSVLLVSDLHNNTSSPFPYHLFQEELSQAKNGEWFHHVFKI